MTVPQWLTENADWISALLGLAAALILAWPLVLELSDRKQFDVLVRLRRQGRTTSATKGDSVAPTPSATATGRADPDEPLDIIREQMTDERLGGYPALLWKVCLGLLLLFASFAFALVYAVTKKPETPVAPTAMIVTLPPVTLAKTNGM